MSEIQDQQTDEKSPTANRDALMEKYDCDYEAAQKLLDLGAYVFKLGCKYEKQIEALEKAELQEA